MIAGADERQTLQVKLVPNWAPVSIVTEPAGAQVLVDGKAQGTTPARLELGGGHAPRRIAPRRVSRTG